MCDYAALEDCSTCQQETSNSCVAACHGENMRFHLPDDLGLKVLVCRLKEIDEEMRCHRNANPEAPYHMCNQHLSEYKAPQYTSIGELLAVPDHFIVPWLAYTTPDTILDTFLSPVGIMTFKLIHWQQALPFITWEPLMQKILTLSLPAYIWVRLISHVSQAMLNVNPPNRAPVILAVMNPDQFARWQNILSQQANNPGTSLFLSTVLKIHAHWQQYMINNPRTTVENLPNVLKDALK